MKTFQRDKFNWWQFVAKHTKEKVTKNTPRNMNCNWPKVLPI